MYKITYQVDSYVPFMGKSSGMTIILNIQVPFKIRKSLALQVMRHFFKLRLSMFKLYIHNKNTNNNAECKIDQRRKCVHNK